MTSRAISAEAVDQFLHELNGEGWKIGTDQFIAARNVMLALTARPELLGREQAVVDWIAPIICRSRADQQIFRARFSAIQQRAEEEGSDEVCTQAAPRPTKVARRTRAVQTAAVVLVLALAAGFAYWMQSRSVDIQSPDGAVRPVKVDSRSGLSVDADSLRLIGGAAAVLALLGLSVLLAARTRKQHDLTKELARESEIDHHFPKIGTSVFLPPDLRRVTQRLRRRRQVTAMDLNIARTVDMTMQQGGFFTPIYATRGLTPEYLALVDRSSVDDQQALLYREVLDRVRGDDVIVDVYEFHGDPRLCRRTDRLTDDGTTLDDLAARFFDRTLLLFTDGAALLHPLTHEPHRWVESLAGAFRHVALLTSRPVAEWDDVEWRLARAGLLVFPSSTAGLSALVDALERPMPAEVDEDAPQGALSPIDHDDTWICNTPPDRQRIADLLSALEARLGEDGMTWLAACAVYPAMHWYLTLYLGTKLGVADMEAKLIEMVRLPWFRRGVMPDWLRAELILTLPRPRERQVRALLDELFRAAVRSGAGRSPIHLVTFRDLHDAAPDDSPLREYVLVRFMKGRSPKALAVRVAEMFGQVKEAVQHRSRRRDPAWRVILSVLPFFGFFFTWGKNASEELRWHAWNGVAVVVGSIACLAAAPYASSLPVVAAIAAIALVAAAHQAIRGARLEVPVFSRMADHLAGAERGEPLNRAWRLVLLVISYIPVVSALLVWIRIPDIRWHARNGLIATTVVLLASYAAARADATVVGGWILMLLPLLALLGLIQGMRRQPLPLGFISRFAGRYPDVRDRDGATVPLLVMPAALIVSLYVVCLIWYVIDLARMPLGLLSTHSAAAVLGLLGGYVADRLIGRRAAVTLGTIAIAAVPYCATWFSGASVHVAVFIGASALLLPSVIALTGSAARSAGANVMASMLFVFGIAVTIVAPLAYAFSSTVDLATPQTSTASGLVGPFTMAGGVVAVVALIWSGRVDRKSDGHDGTFPRFTTALLRAATAFAAAVAVGFLEQLLVGEIYTADDHMVVAVISSVPSFLFVFLALRTASAPERSLFTSLNTSVFGVVLCTIALTSAHYVAGIENVGLIFAEFLTLFVAVALLVPAAWAFSADVPRRSSATVAALSTAILAAGSASGAFLATSATVSPLIVATSAVAVAVMIHARERIAGTWRSTTERLQARVMLFVARRSPAA